MYLKETTQKEIENRVYETALVMGYELEQPTRERTLKGVHLLIKNQEFHISTAPKSYDFLKKLRDEGIWHLVVNEETPRVDIEFQLKMVLERIKKIERFINR